MGNYISLIYDGFPDYSTGPPITGRRYKFKKLGLFKFYGMEKQLQVLAAAESNNVRIAFEHNLKFTLAVYPRRQKITTALFESKIGPL